MVRCTPSLLVFTPCSMRGLDERRGISLLAATGLTFFARSHATQYTPADDKRQPLPPPPRVATPASNATLFEGDCNNIFRRAKDALL